MKNQILVLNCGSSSVKADLFLMENGDPHEKNIDWQRLAKFRAERISKNGSKLSFSITGKDKQVIEQEFKTHEEAIEKITNLLDENLLFNPETRFAIGHRVVHGGEKINNPVKIDDQSQKIIEDCIEFAPLHNPANLKGISFCKNKYGVDQVGVFDTAFHSTIPAEAYSYGIPQQLVQKYQIRRYGFHGTSHEYVAQVVAHNLDMDFHSFSAITLHLGNGASVCAIKDGKSIETSMGYTPLEGLMMGTRCGDLDPAIVFLLQEKEGLSTDEIDLLLNKQSGLKGICGSNDMRDILQRCENNDKLAILARDAFVHRIRRYLGAYVAEIPNCNAIIFTGGIGENSAKIRELVCKDLSHLGINLDLDKNNTRPLGADFQISQKSSSVKIFAQPTDEELMIAQKTIEVLLNK